MSDIEALRAQVNQALSEGRPQDAICYLAELVARGPEDRHTRTALAIALGDAGNPAGALRVLRVLADRLAHQGFLLPAMVAIRHGLQHAPDDAGLVATLKRLHVRSVRAKAGNLPMPPPLKKKDRVQETATGEALLDFQGTERLTRIEEIAIDLGPAGEAAVPLPMPLFCALEEDAFVETVKRLHYKRVPAGCKLLVEGEAGHTLLVIASGHVNISKADTVLAKLGPGTVMGEMALITGAPRSATATTSEEVEVFELARADVEQMAKAKPAVAEELVEYCRKRLIGSLLQTSALFHQFDEATRYLLIDRFQRKGFQPGTRIIEQGQTGQGLFVIATGEVEIAVDSEGGESVVVANLGPGEVFGEISLLKDQPTNARVTARDRVGALFLPRDEFQQILKEHGEVREYLKGLSEDRIKASRAAFEASDIQDADDLIVL